MGAVGAQDARLHVVGERNGEDLVEDPLADGGVLDRESDLHAADEVALHPVGGGEEHLALAARFEVPDPGVLEEAVDDAHHADAIGNAGDAGAQGADAADDEIDLHAGLRSPVERLDHVGLGERVHLGDDAALARLGGDLRLAIDELEDRCLEVERGDLELPPRHRLGVAGEQVEERGCVGAEVLLGGEERQVRVDARGARVVVARSQMHVAVQARALAADDERGFGMGLVADEPVDDVDPRLLEGARPDDVCLLVHASLELDEGGDLLAVLRGPLQRAHYR